MADPKKTKPDSDKEKPVVDETAAISPDAQQPKSTLLSDGYRFKITTRSGEVIETNNPRYAARFAHTGRVIDAGA